MITKEEFTKIIEEKAAEYANTTVFDPEEHPDAVEAIMYDYTSGALEAYDFLASENK